MKAEPTEYRESHLLSVLKGFSWRIVATTTTAMIAYVITGEIEVAVMICSIEFFAKFFIYYGHERFWQLVPRGAIRRIAGLVANQ